MELISDSNNMAAADGELEMIYGDAVEVLDPESFLRSIGMGEQKIAVATGTRGEGVVLMGVPFACDMADGKKSISLVGGFPTDYMKSVLFLDEEEALVDVLPDWKMLVVDDDEQLCESVVASLKSIGIAPDWCMNADDVIRKVEERHNRHDDYQIILLDWKLPGKDGIAIAREIRALYGNDIPILLISAYDWSEIEDEAREAGVTGFIAKPLFKSTLFYGLKPYIEEDLDRKEEGGCFPAHSGNDGGRFFRGREEISGQRHECPCGEAYRRERSVPPAGKVYELREMTYF